MIGHLRHAVLPNQNCNGEQQGVRTDQCLQYEERRIVDMLPSSVPSPKVQEHPYRNEADHECEVGRAAEEFADALDGCLDTRDLGLLAILKSAEELEIFPRAGRQLALRLGGGSRRLFRVLAAHLTSDPRGVPTVRAPARLSL
jgi:hypothetical protein